MKPIQPPSQAQNATAPSAGGSPDGDGKAAAFSDGYSPEEAFRRDRGGRGSTVEGSARSQVEFLIDSIFLHFAAFVRIFQL